MPLQQLPRPFSTLAWSNLAAQSAEQLSLAAAPLVAVLALNAGPGEVGMLAAVQTLPFLLLSLPLGVVADRISRRRLMLFGEALRFASLLALMLAISAASLNIAALSALGFIGAVGTVCFSVAAPGMVASLIRREELAQANSRIELARSAAYAAGPAIAGAIVSWTGAATVFSLAAMLSAIAIVLLLRLANPPCAPNTGKPRLLHEVMEGAAFVMDDALLRPILATGIIFNVSWFVLQAGYVPYAIHHLQLSPGAVGVTLSCYGAGMLVGALGTARIVRRIAFGRAIQLGPIAGALAITSLAATLLLPSQWFAVLCFFLMGAGPMVWTITTTTLRQNMTPDGMLGRVSAVFLTANAGARPLGAVLGGAVGAAWGESACVIVALAGFFMQAAVILWSEVGSLRGSDHRLVQGRA